MAITEHFADFRAYRDQRLLHAPQGGEAFHGQLFPGRYPSDAQAAKEAARAGQRLTVPQEYLDFVAALVGNQVRLKRLVVLYGPDEEQYDPTRREEMVGLLRPAHDAGEVIRLGWYKKFAGALMDVCGADSPYVRGYQQGVKHDQSTYSFWSIRDADGQLEEIWPMSYGPDGRLVKSPVHQRPFDSADAQLIRFEGFWHEAFNDLSLSRPLFPEPGV